MSIDPLRASLSAPPGNRLVTNGRQPQERASFDEALKSAEIQPESRAALVGQAKAAVQLAQLQMLQGLFDIAAEPQEPSRLTGLDEWGTLFEWPPAHSQKLDRLHVDLKPAVPATGSADRNDIEQMIDRIAGNVGLAPELIRSVVAVESDFNPQAVSPAGAQGLMQLMPATAEELSVADSFDPLQNLLGGSQYLKQLLVKYDGDLDRALAAYNWGQGNVDRKGLARMPQETRDYLVKVKARLAERAG